MFYPDIKPHISPSAFAQWHRQRSMFIRSYFKNEKTPETAAMKAGTKIHGLIEAGFLTAIYRFNMNENELVIPLSTGVKVLGRPDSYEKTTQFITVCFVDYKTGRENHWTKEELATDLKMRMTAWLVLQENPKATHIKGIIEWIGTEWNGAELVPTNEPHVCVDYVYTAEELRELEPIILATIDEVNLAYEQFLQAEGKDTVNLNDVAQYVAFEVQIKKLEAEQDEVKARIKDQMDFSGQHSYECEAGSFYTTTKKTYKYPADLKVGYKDMGLMLEDAEEIAAAASAVKKNYELDHEPESVSRSLGFRAKKKK